MITVLMTAYNSAEYIASAINSVLVQNCRNVELLVIDDGSEDKTGEIVESFNCKELRYVRTDHQGRSAALNLGLSMARFDWVTILDSDDMMMMDKLNIYTGLLNRKENLIVTTWMAVFSGKKILYTVKYPLGDSELKKFLLVHAFNNAVLFNRKFILANGGYSELKLAEDYDLWMRIIDKAEFICLPDFLSFHRYSRSSLSNRDFNSTRKQIRTIQSKNSELLDSIKTEASERTDILLRREYYFGESILSIQIREFKFKYVLLFFLSTLPLAWGNYIKILNLKARIIYWTRYYSSENTRIRNLFKTISGDGNYIKVFDTGGDI